MAALSFSSDRSWQFDTPADALWERISATEDYSTWWPWLRSFDDDGGLYADARWKCVVAPPLPYVVRFHVHLARVDRPRLIESTVSGDIGGSATLRIDAVGDERSEARLTSDLHPRNPLLRGFGFIARPLVEYGHNWVLDQGQRQFLDCALEPQ